jgi:hypothetical protein
VRRRDVHLPGAHQTETLQSRPRDLRDRLTQFAQPELRGMAKGESVGPERRTEAGHLRRGSDGRVAASAPARQLEESPRGPVAPMSVSTSLVGKTGVLLSLPRAVAGAEWLVEAHFR